MPKTAYKPWKPAPKDESLPPSARRKCRFDLYPRARRVKLQGKRAKQSWNWDAACSIRGVKDAPKYKDYILPLIFTKRLCDVFDDELNRIAAEVGSRKKAFQLVKADHKLVRFYLPLVPDDPEQPVWSVIRKLSDKIGEGFKNSNLRNKHGKLRIFDRVVANAPRESASNTAKPLRRASRREDNPMWNQDWFTAADYDNDELDRFPAGADFPGKSSADWGWVQHMHVDFPFVLGADGTKILLPNKELYDPRFYYFAMLALELPSRGYNRHFKTLKERSIPLPPLPQQKKIAHILSTVQWAIEAQERIIQTTTELKKTLMHKLFTEGLRHEPQKQTEIGPVPESWEVVELGTLFEKQPQNGIYKHKRDYGSGTQILRIDDFSNDGDVVTRAGNLVALAHSEIETYGLEPGDIVINRVNSLSHLGKTALIGAIGDEMVFESNMMRFLVDESEIMKEDVFKFLNSPLTKKQVIGTAKRAVAQSSINQGDVRSIIVPKPSLEEQCEIVAALDATEAKIAHSTDKAAILQDLFRTLLHELMTAKTRVSKTTFSPAT